MATPCAVLDACVLYPAPVRDLLLQLARDGAYRARWTDDIQNEWMRNVLGNRPDLTATQLAYTRSQMEKHIPDALVTGYAHHIAVVHLPDPDDRHVVAAAIAARADAIVTFNLRDFPAAILEPLDIEASIQIGSSSTFSLNSRACCAPLSQSKVVCKSRR